MHVFLLYSVVGRVLFTEAADLSPLHWLASKVNIRDRRDQFQLKQALKDSHWSPTRLHITCHSADAVFTSNNSHVITQSIFKVALKLFCRAKCNFLNCFYNSASSVNIKEQAILYDASQENLRLFFVISHKDSYVCWWNIKE